MRKRQADHPLTPRSDCPGTPLAPERGFVSVGGADMSKRADEFRHRADDAGKLAKAAPLGAERNRQLMRQRGLSYLADAEDWLDGRRPTTVKREALFLGQSQPVKGGRGLAGGG